MSGFPSKLPAWHAGGGRALEACLSVTRHFAARRRSQSTANSDLTLFHGLDVEAGRILGASSDYATIRSFLAAQLRFGREPREDLVDRYWLVGFRHLQMTKLDGHGGVLGHDPDTALSIGHGWRHTFGNGARALTEIGFIGGCGFMGYVSFGIQWRFLRGTVALAGQGGTPGGSRPPGPSWPRSSKSAPSRG
jgi:hypothetical protein